MSKLTRPRFAVFYLLVPLAFLTASSSPAQFVVGIPLVCLGLAVRLWANSHVGHRKVNVSGAAKIGELVTGGPYAFVRHPLYVGTLLIAAGIGVIVGRLWLGGLGLAALIIIYHRKMAEEERTLETEWGAAFTSYRQAVPRWRPRLTPYARGGEGWSWRGIAASKEWKTVAWVIVAVIALYLRQVWVRERDLFAGPRAAAHAVLAGLAVALMAADGLAELWRLRARRAAHGA